MSQSEKGNNSEIENQNENSNIVIRESPSERNIDIKYTKLASVINGYESTFTNSKRDLSSFKSASSPVTKGQPQWEKYNEKRTTNDVNDSAI